MTKRLKEDLQKLGDWKTSAPTQPKLEGFEKWFDESGWKTGKSAKDLLPIWNNIIGWRNNENDALIQDNASLYKSLTGEVNEVFRLEKENERLREIERRYRWIEEHLEDFDQLNIPEKE